MTAQTLPDDPNYCFVPAYDIEDEVQQIRIVVDGMTGYIPTALVALTIVDGGEAMRPAQREARTLARGLDRACGKVHARRGTRAR